MAVTSINKQIYSALPFTTTNDHGEKPSQWVASLFLVILLGFFLLVAFITTVIENDLPNPIRERDISRDDANTFSEISAKGYLQKILGDQPRVSGTTYHFAKTRDLKELIDVIARFASMPIHTDWQYVEGDYWLAASSPHVNVYQNLSNVVAVLEGESGFNTDGTTRSSILINCHYDSVPFAMGASDNGVFCAVMAETLSKFSRRNKKFKHNVIFLFNGAEENVLLGSHGFLHHPWSKGVISVINLDSAGMNGRPNVFQVTDPRVLEIYRRTTSRPIAQGVGQFLFSTGIIPSDTDFRIWRDFGNITGIDIAFVRWGNVYHTRNDKPDLIHDGVIQNAGDMLLNLVRELADCQELTVREQPFTLVYFDYLGLFLVTYSSGMALLMDVVVGVLGLLSVGYFLWLFGHRWSAILELLWSIVARVVSLVAGAATVALFTLVMIATTTQMRYLSEHWIVVPLYWMPYLVTAVTVSHGFDSWRTDKSGQNRSIRASQAMAATRFLVSVFLLALCCVSGLANLRYLITIPLLVMTVASMVTVTAVRYGRLKAWQHLLLEVFLNLPATMFAFSLATRLNSLLIPIMGRSGTDNPDVIIAAANTMVAIVAASTMSGIELLFSRRRLWTVISGVSIVSIIIMFIPLSPYRDENTVQRHYWFHSQITSYDRDMTPIERVSGVLVTKIDAYNVQSAITAIKSSSLYIDEIKQDDQVKLRIKDDDLNIMNEECEKFLYCNMPMFRPRFEIFINNSLFISMGPPAQFRHSLKLTNRSCTENNCSLGFLMDGPAHNAITIWPRQNVTLTSWSFNSPVKETLIRKGRPVYTILHSTGTYTEFFEPLEFTLNLTVIQPLQSVVMLDVSHHAHKIHHPQDFTDEYRQLLDAMPDYFNIASFLTFRSNYVF